MACLHAFGTMDRPDDGFPLFSWTLYDVCMYVALTCAANARLGRCLVLLQEGFELGILLVAVP